MTQSRLFDGFEITTYEGTFSGGFDMDEELASDLRFDDQVTFIVTGRIHDVGLKSTKLGDLKRVNKFQITSSVTLDPETATKVLNSIGSQVPGVNGGQLKLGQDPTSTFEEDDEEDENIVSAGIPISDSVLANFLNDAS